MSKNSEMYINDSKGYESEAKESYRRILSIFTSTEGWSQEKLASLLGINSTTLRKYRREGSVSLYTTKRLSTLLNLNRDYFNGKQPVTKEVEIIIQKRLHEITGNPMGQPEMSEDKRLFQILRDKAANVNSYNEYNLTELEELKALLEKNNLMVTARAQIVRVVESGIIKDKEV